MKRVTVFVICVLLLFAFAFSALADEILFRGVSWGVNPLEARKQIDDPNTYMQATYTNGSVAYPSKTAERLLDHSKNYWYGNYEFFSQKEILTRVCSGFFDKEVKVAGYKLDLLNMYFANDVQDGKINYDEDSLHFAIAEYTFNIVDGTKAYGDLKDKLTSLYGEGEEQLGDYKGSFWYDDKAHNYSTKTSIVTFSGDNGTHALLYCIESVAEEDPEHPVYEVTLTYWSEKYENMIHEMDAILAEDEYNVQFQQEQNVDQNDINGL